MYGTTKAEVAEEIRKLQAVHDAGRLIETEEMTTGEYLTRWLKSVSGSVGATTWERYRHMVELRLNPILGKIPLRKLRHRSTSNKPATHSRTTRLPPHVE